MRGIVSDSIAGAHHPFGLALAEFVADTDGNGAGKVSAAGGNAGLGVALSGGFIRTPIEMVLHGLPPMIPQRSKPCALKAYVRRALAESGLNARRPGRSDGGCQVCHTRGMTFGGTDRVRR